LARPGAFKSEKRKKELMRQKKQEKKRQRRLGKDSSTGDMSGEEIPTADGSVEVAPSEEKGEQEEETE
jgi:hypothetical protein